MPLGKRMKEAAGENWRHCHAAREEEKNLAVPGITPDYGRMRRENKTSGRKTNKLKDFNVFYKNVSQ